MKTALFEHECVKVSKTLGRKHDIRVLFRGRDAKTDGNTVVLPALDQLKDLSAEQVKVGRGYVDHETAHLIYTDMPAYQEAATSRLKAGDKLYPMVLNALEDIRIERCMRADYPGAMTNLTSTAEAVNLEYLQRYKKEPEIAQDPRVVGAIALTWEGRKRDGYPTVTNDQCLDTLDPRVRGRIAKWIDAVAACNSTADVIALADLCAQDLRAAAKEPKEPPPEEAPKEKGKGKGKKGKGKGEKAPETQEPCEGQGEGEPEPEQQGKGEAEGDKPEQEKGEAEGGGKPERGDGEEEAGGAGGGGEEDGESFRDSIENDESEPEPARQGDYEAGKEEAGEAEVQQGGKGGGEAGSSSLGGEVAQAELDDPEPIAVTVDIEGVLGTRKTNSRDRYVAWDTSFDQVHTRKTDISLNDPMGDAHYEKVKSSISGVLSVMRRKIERALIAREQRGWQGGHEWGRLDNRRLVGAYRGDTDVFRLKEERKEVNTAVTILIDLSGSMRGGSPTKIVLAEQSAIALTEAIARNGVALEVLGFHCMTMAYDGSVSGSADEWEQGYHSGQKFSRWSRLDHVVFKDFSEDVRVARRSLAAIRSQVGGDNCDGESVMWAYQRLAKRPEPRKIMLVLSDGQPATSTSYDEDHLGQHLRDVVGYIEGQRDTTILGVGIASPAVGHYYSRHVVVRSVTELGGTVMDQLSRLMLGERFTASNADLFKANKL